MIKKLILIITLFVYTNGALAADCTTPVILLDANKSTPCRGYLFSPAKELEVYGEVQNYKLLQQENTLKDSMITDLQKEISDLKTAVTESEKKSELWEQQAESATKEYVDESHDRETKDLLLFGSGVLTTVVLGLIVGYVIRK